MRRGRDRARMAGPAPDYPDELPRLRRIVVVIDLDSGRPLVRMWQLWRTRRCDSYRLRDGLRWGVARIGWARVLWQIREAYCRVSSPRHRSA